MLGLNVFNIPDKLTTSAGITIPGLHVFVIVLRRLTSTFLYSDIASMFGREIAEMSMLVMYNLFNRYGYRLLELDQVWLSADNS